MLVNAKRLRVPKAGRSIRIAGLFSFCILVSSQLLAQPDAALWSFWDQSDQESQVAVNHSLWGEILDTYLKTNTSDGINRFDYGAVTGEDRAKLDVYISMLQATAPRALNKSEQLAYWVNLYNALTVRLVIDEYPVSSIRRTGKRFLSFGPWDDEIAEVEGQVLTLNDIEHRIIRPIWQDFRIHFVVNCASLGCPSLQPAPFTGRNMETMLEKAAYEFLAHPRGANIDGDRLVLSKIFDWYAEDFGQNDDELKRSLSQYMSEEIAEVLCDGRISYEYNWSLNDI